MTALATMPMHRDNEFVVPLPPLPSENPGFPEDEPFRGITKHMDLALEHLHAEGWSLRRLYASPNAVIPLPTPRFPAGRVYLFSDHAAIVVDRSTGRIATTLPVAAAPTRSRPHITSSSTRWTSRSRAWSGPSARMSCPPSRRGSDAAGTGPRRTWTSSSRGCAADCAEWP